MVHIVVKRIKLSDGQLVKVDADTWEWARRLKWHPQWSGRHTCYAARGKPDRRWRQVTSYMHREILGALPPGTEVDHLNGDGLDNRRANLQAVTHGENAKRAWARRKAREAKHGDRKG